MAILVAKGKTPLALTYLLQKTLQLRILNGPNLTKSSSLNLKLATQLLILYLSTDPQAKFNFHWKT